MGRATVLQRSQQESELLLGFFIADIEQVEYRRLHRSVMYADQLEVTVLVRRS